MAATPDSEQLRFIYAVVFSRQTPSELYSPLIQGVGSPDEGTAPHLLDYEVVPALPAVWYCLHLPPTIVEFLDLSLFGLPKRQRFSNNHEIALVPSDFVTQLPDQAFRRRGIPAFLYCPRSLIEELRADAERLGFVDGPVSIEDVSPQKLAADWKRLREFQPNPRDHELPEIAFCEEAARCVVSVSTYHLARQMNADAALRKTSADLERAKLQAMHLQRVLRVLSEFEREGLSLEEADARFKASYRESFGRGLCPVAIALPGVAPRYVRELKSGGHVVEPIDWQREEANHTFDTNPAAWSDYRIEDTTIARGLLWKAIEERPMGAFRRRGTLRLWQRSSSGKRFCDRVKTIGRP